MEDEGEIECLEEDEDLVQQLLLKAPAPTPESYVKSTPLLEDEELLVERRPQLKRKPDDDDSDYDPAKDANEIPRKKKRYPKKYSGPSTSTAIQMVKNQERFINVKKNLNPNLIYEDKLKSLPNLTVKKQPVSNKVFRPIVQDRKFVKRISYNDLAERRKLDIRIPDYEDPICLPVRALKHDESDLKRLKLWNKLCLDQYRKIDTPLKSFRGGVPVKSNRLVVLRNIKDRITGRINTSIYGKTVVTDSQGESKSESFQSVLPNYREKKVLPAYPLTVGGVKRFSHSFEVVLSKETSNTDDTLVVYKPKEAVSAVYKFAGNKPSMEEQDENKVCKRVVRETTCAKVCAPCYHTSWRGVSRHSKEQVLQCPMCPRSFTSVYSLLTHVKNSHTGEEVRRARPQLSNVLAQVVEYHYKCRICREQLPGIKELRKHVAGRHQGVEVFKCEVGNHMAT